MTFENRRAKVAFSGASIFLIGVVLLTDNHSAESAVASNEHPAMTPQAFLAKRSMPPAAMMKNYFWTPEVTDPESLSINDVRDIMKQWISAAMSRDIDAIVELYDPEVGKLLGTVDDSSSPRRSSRALIREYFNHFLGDNEKVVPIFPRFDAKDVQFVDDKTAVYSGYYTFELTPIGGNTKIANAKFTYIVHKTLQHGVQLVLHNSGLTPHGVVMKD